MQTTLHLDPSCCIWHLNPGSILLHLAQRQTSSSSKLVQLSTALSWVCPWPSTGRHGSNSPQCHHCVFSPPAHLPPMMMEGSCMPVLFLLCHHTPCRHHGINARMLNEGSCLPTKRQTSVYHPSCSTCKRCRQNRLHTVFLGGRKVFCLLGNHSQGTVPFSVPWKRTVLEPFAK